MALSQSVASELLEAFRAGEGVDLIRESVRLVMQNLIEVDVAEQIRAAHRERPDHPQRADWRRPARLRDGERSGRIAAAHRPADPTGGKTWPSDMRRHRHLALFRPTSRISLASAVDLSHTTHRPTYNTCGPR
jgi:hypothetical protein